MNPSGFDTSPAPDHHPCKDRSVIFTADDFGAVDSINQGIIRGIETGLVTAVSALVTFPESLNAISDLRRRFPDIGIGLQFSLSAGAPMHRGQVPSLINESEMFRDKESLTTGLNELDIGEVRSEMEAQLRALLNVAGRVDHITSHHNIAGFATPVFQVMLHIAGEYELSIRSPMCTSINFKENRDTKIHRPDTAQETDRPFKRPIDAVRISGNTSSLLMQRHQTILNETGVRHPDYLVDTFWRKPTPFNLFTLLKNLPEGESEVVFHLGICEAVITGTDGMDDDYLFTRELELFCLNPYALPRWLERLDIQLTPFA